MNRFGVPSAHAPMVNFKDLDLADPVVDARSAGEMASASGLACVLIGLAKAPQISGERCRVAADVIGAGSFLAVVAPAGCLGGIPCFCAHQRGIPIVAVRENGAILGVEASKVGFDNVIEVGSYLV